MSLEVEQTTREEFACYWADDEGEPLVLYSTYEEAAGIASLGGAMVLRRVVLVSVVEDWHPVLPNG